MLAWALQEEEVSFGWKVVTILGNFMGCFIIISAWINKRVGWESLSSRSNNMTNLVEEVMDFLAHRSSSYALIYNLGFFFAPSLLI